MSDTITIDTETITSNQPTAPERRFRIENGARSVHTRVARTATAQRRGMKQFVGDQQQRVMRGRPIVWTESQVVKNLAELRDKVKKGLIRVLSATDGSVLDLDTFELGAPRPDSAAPHPPMDSLANDRVPAELIPQFPGGPSPTAWAPGHTPEGTQDGNEIAPIVETPVDGDGKELAGPPPAGMTAAANAFGVGDGEDEEEELERATRPAARPVAAPSPPAASSQKKRK